jgi:asparagine synthetase B (glutamine-hydrolysing)
MLTSDRALDAAWLAAFGPGLELIGAPAHWAPSIIESPSGRIIFDGVLHNQVELRRALGAHDQGGSSDAELVGEAYRAWGEAAVRRLRGVFALIIADTAREDLLCARDPAGVHPLFYVEVGRRILLSPSVAILLAEEGVSTELNRATLVARLTRRWLAPEETYFSSVRRVPAGHVVQVGRDGRRVYRYWTPVPVDRPIEWIPDDEAPERFEAALSQSIARILALGPGGLYMSGGLDSSMLAMISADLCRRRGWPAPLGLSLLFSLSDLDEARVQRGVATQLALPQIQLPFDEAAGPRGTFAAALEMTRTLPAPLALIWRPALMRLALDGRERGCRVILAGDGGDEWLWDNPIQAADLLRALDVPGLYRLWRIYARSYHFSPSEAFRIVMWRCALKPVIPQVWRRAALAAGARRLVLRRGRVNAIRTAASPSWVAPDPTLRAQVAERLEESYARRATAPRTESFYLRDTRSRLDAPEKWFRDEETFLIGRRTGVSVREPFWDPDLIELLVRVRPQARSARGLAKALVRRPLARRFPGLGFEHQRKSWLGRALLSVLTTQTAAAREIVGPLRALEDLGVVDGRQLGALLDESLAGNGPAWQLVWAWEVFNLEEWARVHA